MVLRASWASFGLHFGALEGSLWSLWAPLRCYWGSLGSFLEAKEPSWAPLGCSCCPYSRLLSFDLLRRRCFFITWGLFGSILGLQDDPPTLKNQAPASAAARFLKNRRLRSEGGLQSVLGLSWASFGRSWVSLGGLLGFSGVLLGGSWELLGSQGIILGSSWVLLLSFFSALLV